MTIRTAYLGKAIIIIKNLRKNTNAVKGESFDLLVSSISQAGLTVVHRENEIICFGLSFL